MLFLNATDPATIKLAKTAIVDFGYRAQRFGNAIARRIGVAQRQTKGPPPTHGKPPLKAQVIHMFNKPMPGGLPKRTARALLDIEDKNYVPIIRDHMSSIVLLGVGIGVGALGGSSAYRYFKSHNAGN